MKGPFGKAEDKQKRYPEGPQEVWQTEQEVPCYLVGNSLLPWEFHVHTAKAGGREDPTEQEWDCLFHQGLFWNKEPGNKLVSGVRPAPSQFPHPEIEF